jgi:hypothetical protein
MFKNLNVAGRDEEENDDVRDFDEETEPNFKLDDYDEEEEEDDD